MLKSMLFCRFGHKKHSVQCRKWLLIHCVQQDVNSVYWVKMITILQPSQHFCALECKCATLFFFQIICHGGWQLYIACTLDTCVTLPDAKDEFFSILMRYVGLWQNITGWCWHPLSQADEINASRSRFWMVFWNDAILNLHGKILCSVCIICLHRCQHLNKCKSNWLLWHNKHKTN